MTWVITAPADDTESDERVHATAALAVVAVDTLTAAGELLMELAGNSAAEDAEVSLRLGQLDQLRTALIETFKIHKAVLPPTVLEELRKGFDLAELTDPEARKALTEEVVGHPVERLAELDPEEARALKAALADREPKF